MLMANRQTNFDERECNVSQGQTSNRGLVRIDGKPFESPRGRGRCNPGWGRVNGIPFVSQRGRGRVILLGRQSEDHQIPTYRAYEDIMNIDTTSRTFNPAEDHSEQNDHDLRHLQPNMMSSDGRLFYCGLKRIDNKPFESPRGRGRNNPGWGRVDDRPFVSQRGRIAHESRSVNTYIASAPSYEAVMDVE